MKEKTEEMVHLGLGDADRRLRLTGASGGEGKEVGISDGRADETL